MTPGSASSWADLHLDALYERTPHARILRVRSTDVGTPLVHLLRTAEANYGLVAASVPREAAEAITRLFAAEPVVGPEAWEEAPPRCAEAVRALLPPASANRGPAFAFPAVLPSVTPAAGFSIEVLEDLCGVVTAPMVAWIAEAKPAEQPLVVVRDASGRVVAVCHAARRSDAAAEAGLEVDPSVRRAGLGVAVAAAWAAAVRAGGREPLYSTSWENQASRGVARRVGLALRGEDWHLD
ncbi:MAG: GNAT family N-acetyltransferase [Dehalococcoidia bacterium]|nr:GNAT family N-acetyltransferase [Dehalococcoidia bacterium]